MPFLRIRRGCERRAQRSRKGTLPGRSCLRLLRSPVRGSVAKLTSVTVSRLFAATLAALLGTNAGASAATPAPAPRSTEITVHLPNVPLHSEVVVEVNKKGQVVRVKSTKPSKSQSFNLKTYGNALQMWIRKCRTEGSATKCDGEVGLYRVSYDYDPKTTKVTRRVALVSAGGNWGNEEGAANVMMQMLKKQEEAAAAAAHKAQESNAKLPSLNEIRGQPTPKPTPKPTHAPTLPPR